MSETALLERIRAAALIAVLAAAAGSLGLMFLAARRSPPLLIVVFFFWVLSPFVALVFAHAASRRWSGPARTVLYGVMLVIALGSLAVYADDARGHRRPQAAFVYVIVPPVSWLLLAIVVPAAALTAGRRSRSKEGADSPAQG